MSDQSRLVRDLLDANLQLTAQFIELARLAIGAPPQARASVDTYEELTTSGPERPSEFTLSSADDWEDIPDRPLGGGAQILEIPRRVDPDIELSDLPLHMTEEEEDMRHAVAMSLRPASDLSDLLTRLGTPGAEVIEFTAPDA